MSADGPTSDPRPPLRREPLRPTYFFTPDLEREIGRLEGITAARVLSTGTEIEEIHVLAQGQRPPKKIVRDIESLLLVRFGVHIDHRCISIVQGGDQRPTYEAATRPVIRDVARSDNLVRVVLKVGDTELTGEAPAEDGQAALAGAARALIHAIEQMLQTSGMLTLTDIQLHRAGEHQVVVVLVRWLFAGQLQELVGAGLVTDDPLAAAARATLDSMNRRLVRFQQAHSGENAPAKP